MKISASLYSSKQRSLNDLVSALDRCHIDYFHIDCNDDPSVFQDIAHIKNISKTPIDLHIISSNPSVYFPLIEAHKPDLVTFQFENLMSSINLPKIKGVKYGLALVSDTPVDVFEQYKDQCDFVLIMTTTPGQSGGKFRKDNFKKIRRFRSTFPVKDIHIDGGVNDETGFILRILGVNSVVSGSFLVNHQSIGEALLHLRSSVIHSDFQIRDFMMDLDDAPVLEEKVLSVANAITAIEAGNVGFVVIRKNNGKLKGVISNADLRKGLIKNLSDLNSLSVSDILNENPVCINEACTITELLMLIKSKQFLISFLPVVDRDQQLRGALSFINLIKSES